MLLHVLVQIYCRKNLAAYILLFINLIWVAVLLLFFSMEFVHLNCTIRYFVLQGMPYSPVKFTGAPDARCLQGMPYSPVKFTGAPDARCLQGMPYSPVKFTGAPDARCLQGMPYSPVKFTGAPDARCLQGMPYSPVKFTGAPDAQCLHLANKKHVSNTRRNYRFLQHSREHLAGENKLNNTRSSVAFFADTLDRCDPVSRFIPSPQFCIPPGKIN